MIRSKGRVIGQRIGRLGRLHKLDAQASTERAGDVGELAERRIGATGLELLDIGARYLQPLCELGLGEALLPTRPS